MVFTIENMETSFRDIFPVTARMRTGLTAGHVNIPGRINISGLTKVFDAECRMQTDGHTEVLLKELAVHAPSILLGRQVSRSSWIQMRASLSSLAVYCFIKTGRPP